MRLKELCRIAAHFFTIIGPERIDERITTRESTLHFVFVGVEYIENSVFDNTE